MNAEKVIKGNNSIKRIAVIRVRGSVKTSPMIEDTLKMLRLYRKNRCIVVPSTKSYIGMISKVKDYCTFGEIDEETFMLLLQKRGRIVGDKPITDQYIKQKASITVADFARKFISGKAELKNISGLKQFFKLHPPIGGFEREGIKKPYTVGGTLGYRGDAINKLIKKMI